MSNVSSEIQSKFDEKCACLKKVHDVDSATPVETRRTLLSIVAGWPIVSDVIDRIRIAGDRNVPLERRIFAALEAVFFPVSALTVVAMFVLPVLGWCGVPVSRLHQGGLGWAMTIFTSAAIGYLTNWIAIEMLFKPYYPTKRHFFAWITCGIWRQGLVPKNKNQIADVMGKEVAQKLLRPEQLANDLCAMAGEIIRNPNIISSLRNGVQHAIAAHDQEIAAFLAPKIETALREELNRLVTVDKVEEFWTAHIEPRLQSAETRDQIATIVIGALEKRSSSLASKAKPLIVGAIEKYVREGPLLVRPLAGLAGLIADVIVSRDFLEAGLRNWLKAPETVPALRDELLHFVGSVRDFVKSDESRGKIGTFVEEIRSTFKDYVSSYLEKNLVNVTGRLLNSESFWNSVTEMIPKFQPEIERLIRTEGMPIILENLDIQGRIKTAVDKMDVKEFHGMINEVAAQHLGAIQVLGFILGAIAGALTRLF